MSAQAARRNDKVIATSAEATEPNGEAAEANPEATERDGEATQKFTEATEKFAEVTQETPEVTEKFTEVTQADPVVVRSTGLPGHFGVFGDDFTQGLGNFFGPVCGLGGSFRGFVDFLRGLTPALCGFRSFLGDFSEFLSGITRPSGLLRPLLRCFAVVLRDFAPETAWLRGKPRVASRDAAGLGFFGRGLGAAPSHVI